MFRTVQMIDVNDWDALVQKTYGKPYYEVYYKD